MNARTQDSQTLISLAARNLPRYTSYPTAPHSKPLAAEDYEAWLGAIPPGLDHSLYLHVPFCAQMCWYCGCHTKVVGRYQPVADYAGSLFKEAALVTAALPPGPRASSWRTRGWGSSLTRIIHQYPVEGHDTPHPAVLFSIRPSQRSADYACAVRIEKIPTWHDVSRPSPRILVNNAGNPRSSPGFVAR